MNSNKYDSRPEMVLFRSQCLREAGQWALLLRPPAPTQSLACWESEQVTDIQSAHVNHLQTRDADIINASWCSDLWKCIKPRGLVSFKFAFKLYVRKQVHKLCLKWRSTCSINLVHVKKKHQERQKNFFKNQQQNNPFILARCLQALPDSGLRMRIASSSSFFLTLTFYSNYQD